jgi:cathepsin B
MEGKTHADVQKMLIAPDWVKYSGAATMADTFGTLTTVPGLKEARSPRASGSFDATTRWPECPTIAQIQNQGDCGSCWAFAASHVLADRTCIATGGTYKRQLSPQYTMDCLGVHGCAGGFPDIAWHRLVANGTTTAECVPYEETAQQCQKTCRDGTTTVPIRKAATAYSLFVPNDWPATEELIKADIEAHGPIGVAFHVFDDFSSYKRGVYQRSAKAEY